MVGTSRRCKSWLGRLAMGAAIAACFCTSNARAAEPDEYLAAALTAHILDWSQTRYISSHCDTFHETNPVLGLCPSAAHVNTYFLGTAVMLTAAHLLLPEKYAKYITGVWLVLEGGTVARNARMGIKLDF